MLVVRLVVVTSLPVIPVRVRLYGESIAVGFCRAEVSVASAHIKCYVFSWRFCDSFHQLAFCI